MTRFLIVIFVFIILFYSMCNHEIWWNGCDFNFTDISQTQVFECKPKENALYQVEMSFKGEVSDTLMLDLYFHRDLNHTGIEGTTFIESHKLMRVVGKKSRVALNKKITRGWGTKIKLFGVLRPSVNATGYLKVAVNFTSDYILFHWFGFCFFCIFCIFFIMAIFHSMD